MKSILLPSLIIAFVLTFTTRVCAESNDSLEALTNAQAVVQLKLDQFAKTNADYELLLAAQKASASLNPRGDKSRLGKLDEDCLRLQLKVLLALAEARDPHYDRNAQTNIVYLNVSPPLSRGTGPLMAGMDPQAIKNLEVRQAYEEAITQNHRRNDKLRREMALSRGVDYALIDIWIFTWRGFPENSEAQKSAVEIVRKTIPDKTLLERFNSQTMPGLTW
jgi:hypothetical protein